MHTKSHISNPSLNATAFILKFILMKKIFAALGVLFLWSCNTQQLPTGATAVTNFEQEKYLGKWYEIARLDFTFEKDMDNTMAEYALNKDKSIKVINSGYNYKKEKWSQVEGKAKFVGEPSLAELKVSFFGPFYAPYNVIALEGDYKYALVVGKNTDYLWILSREKTIPNDVKERFLALAKDLGYHIDDLVWPTHDRIRPDKID